MRSRLSFVARHELLTEISTAVGFTTSCRRRRHTQSHTLVMSLAYWRDWNCLSTSGRFRHITPKAGPHNIFHNLLSTNVGWYLKHKVRSMSGPKILKFGHAFKLPSCPIPAEISQSVRLTEISANLLLAAMLPDMHVGVLLRHAWHDVTWHDVTWRIVPYVGLDRCWWAS